MSAVHREWGNAQADRVVLVVDQVASVKSAPAHQPKRFASVSRATAREQAVLLILATCAMALVGCSEPPEIEAERDNAAAFQDAIANAEGGAA